MSIKLKPVCFTTNNYKRGSVQPFQQAVLLRALQVTQDPNKLKQMMGVRTVAEVYRTLDKLSIRKEYHEALSRAGISLDFIVGGIKTIAATGEKDGDKLKAYQLLLKSIGLEKYESDESSGGGSWEQELMKGLEKKKENPALPEAQVTDFEYEVDEPPIPKSVIDRKEGEEEMMKSIYE